MAGGRDSGKARIGAEEAMNKAEPVKSQRLTTLPSASAKAAIARPGAEGGTAKLKRLVQELRRQTTLMNAELHEQREANEELEFQLLKVRSQLQQTRSELVASRERRKEMGRIIAKRDAELQARYSELAALERHILRTSPSWMAGELMRRARRLLRRTFSADAGS